MRGEGKEEYHRGEEGTRDVDEDSNNFSLSLVCCSAVLSLGPIQHLPCGVFQFANSEEKRAHF